MRITSIETIAYQNVTEVHSGGVGWLWVRIHTDSGHYGTGETFPPPDSEKAIIGDPRNDENVIIAQLHALFLQFHNRLADELQKGSRIAPTFTEVQPGSTCSACAGTIGLSRHAKQTRLSATNCFIDLPMRPDSR